MIKFKGVEYQVSMFKAYIPDNVCKKLKEIKELMELEDNIQALCHSIDFVHNLLSNHKKYVENGEIPDTTLKNDSDDQKLGE